MNGAVSFTIKDHRAVDAYASNRLSDFQPGMLYDAFRIKGQGDPDLTLIRLFLYFCNQKMIRPDTINQYDDHLNILLNYAQSINKSLIDLDPIDLQNHLSYLLDAHTHDPDSTPLHVTTTPARLANQSLRLYKIFYNFLWSTGHVIDNPAYHINYLPDSRKPKQIISPEDFDTVIDSMPFNDFPSARNYCIALLLWETKFPLDRIPTLHMPHLIIAESSILLVIHKTGKEQVYKFSNRTGKAMFRYIVDYRGILGVNSKYIFPTASGRPIHNRNIHRSIYRAGKRAGIKINPRMIRFSPCHQNDKEKSVAVFEGGEWQPLI